jgi:RNA 3'-terminal phosphate cyclase (ATP)
VLEVPGDLLEGGGQIVRTTIALSALTGKPVKLTKIRDKRPNPGLQAQHVVAVKAVGAICNAETQGLTQGSQELTFTPHGYAAGQLSFDVGTAGSIPLILQALMPAAAYAPNKVNLDLTGGTDVRWSPPIDYVRLIQLPLLQQMGYLATIRVDRRGHYPKGGGRVSISVDPPRVLKAVSLMERGWLLGIEGISHCVRLPSHVAQRQANAAQEKLNAEGFRFTNVNVATETYPSNQDPHVAPGSGITLLAKFSSGTIVGSDSLGERGKPAESVGADAATKLLAELTSGAPVDRHMGDILIPYIAVAEGRSMFQVSEITMHTLTNIKVAEMVAGVKFDVEGALHGPGRIGVTGLALKT